MHWVDSGARGIVNTSHMNDVEKKCTFPQFLFNITATFLGSVWAPYIEVY